MRDPDTLELVKRFGMTEVSAVMAIPYMWFTAGGSDPYSPVVIMIVQNLQRGLQRLGYQTRGDGFIDKATSRALHHVSPNWKGKSWEQIYTDVARAIDKGQRKGVPMRMQRTSPQATSGPFEWIQDKLEAGGKAVEEAGEFLSEQRYTTVRSGQGLVCKPNKGPPGKERVFLKAFQELQRQLNRVLSKVGRPTIAVDGDLGPATTGALKVALQRAGLAGKISLPDDCEDVAFSLERYTKLLRSWADRQGVSARVSAPKPSSPPSVIDPQTGEEMTVKTAGLGGLADQPFILFAALGVGGALIWSQTRGKKKRRRKRRRR